MEYRAIIDSKAKKEADTFGTNYGNPEVQKKILAGAASDGAKAVEVAKKDIEKMLSWWNKKEWKMEERFDPPPFKVFYPFFYPFLLFFYPFFTQGELNSGEAEQWGTFALCSEQDSRGGRFCSLA